MFGTTSPHRTSNRTTHLYRHVDVARWALDGTDFEDHGVKWRHHDVRKPGTVGCHYDGRGGEELELLSDGVSAEELHHIVVWEVLDKGISNLRPWVCVLIVA